MLSFRWNCGSFTSTCEGCWLVGAVSQPPLVYIGKSFYSCFVSIPKSSVFRSFSNEEPCVGHVTVLGVQSRLELKPLCHGSGRERVSIKVKLSPPLRKCAGGVWALVPTSGGGTHPGGSQAMMLTMTAALTSSPHVFPYLSFSQPAASRSLAHSGHVT